jgi:hypothetical protein
LLISKDVTLVPDTVQPLGWERVHPLSPSDELFTVVSELTSSFSNEGFVRYELVMSVWEYAFVAYRIANSSKVIVL